MADQIPLDSQSIIEISHPDNSTTEVADDLAYRRLLMVNVIFYGKPGSKDRQWVLVDTGLRGFCPRILKAAHERFGAESRPAAIILTHGHSDHSGCVEALAEKWDTPVYAHPLEFPFLDGTKPYPPPSPSVGGGLVSLLAPLFPRGPINISKWLHPLPEDGSVPGMPQWRWIHTPGHSPGHVSLWRPRDRFLIVGDAFITTNQESAYAVAVQKPQMHGPPQFQTPDWEAAQRSVKILADLDPEVVITGHGRAMHGPKMQQALHTLAQKFTEVAVPQ
jgi:glyoxylase-like metal-dependent hydrolase (beta-lactamase superfamily II)